MNWKTLFARWRKALTPPAPVRSTEDEERQRLHQQLLAQQAWARAAADASMIHASYGNTTPPMRDNPKQRVKPKPHSTGTSSSVSDSPSYNTPSVDMTPYYSSPSYDSPSTDSGGNFSSGGGDTNGGGGGSDW